MALLSTQELEELKTLVASFKPQLEVFEREILIPQIKCRLEYAKEIFESFIVICNDTNVATDIDAAVRQVMPVPAGTQTPQAGQSYLTQVRTSVQTNYIAPIDDLLRRFFVDGNALENVDVAIKFLNQSMLFFEIVLGVKDEAFMYSLRTFVNVTNRQTGQVMLGPPQEIALILMPFQTRLAELVNVAKTSSESIKAWGEDLKRKNQKHVDLLMNVSQVKVAQEQKTAATHSMWFQFLVIVVTIILVALSHPITTYVEKVVLADALTENLSAKKKTDELLKSTEATCKDAQQKLSEKIGSIEQELSACKSKSVK